MLYQIVICAVAVVSFGWLALRFVRPSKLPPGPKGLPVLGNALQLPSQFQFIKLTEWAKELGDIYTLNVAGKKLIVLSSAKSAAEILDRMSAVTSGRPRLVMVGEIMTRNLLYGFMPAEDRWRRLRQVTHEGFNIRACETYYPFQESEAANLILALLEDPTCLESQLRRVAANSVWRALYSGSSLTPEEEEKVQRISGIGLSLLRASTPLAYIVNVLPFLKVLPPWMTHWRCYGEDFFHNTDSFFQELFQEAKLQRDGVQPFLASSAKSFKRFDVTDQEAAWTGGGLFAAGVDSTAASLHHFILAMILYPDSAKMAQKHIDNVIGSRLPTLRDRDQLPYMQALVKEILRWRPVAPLSLPHVATEGFEYRGFVVPKGTILLSNIWAITHDPEFFEDPEAFRPERYLNSDGSLKDPTPNYHDDVVSYGYGRRICPGRDFANNSMFIDMTFLLWAFDILGAKDEAGKEIAPDSMAFEDHGLAYCPSSFRYELRPRRACPQLKETLTST